MIFEIRLKYTIGPSGMGLEVEFKRRKRQISVGWAGEDDVGLR